MIEIGKTKLVVVRKGKGRDRQIVKGADGQPEKKVVESVVKRITRDVYGHNSRYSRKLIVTLCGPDLITLRPVGLRTEALVVSTNIGKLYKDLLARRSLAEGLAKAREKKAKIAQARNSRRLAEKERRFTRNLRTANGSSDKSSD